MLFRRTSHVAWRRVEDETVLVNLERRRMLGLNEAGGRVWEALAQPGAPADLARALPDPPEPAQVARVTRFLRALEREGVVERAGDDAAPLDDAATATAAAPAAPDAPAITWQEEITRCAGSCGTLPSQSPLCDGGPFTS